MIGDIMENPKLDREAFIEWFKANSPHCGKIKTMEKICEEFPESTITINRSFPPYGQQLYSSIAATLMNQLKGEEKIKTYKKGRSYCYEWIGD